MNTVENKTFDQERALYGSRELLVKNCSFTGPADGESALKECREITAEGCFFNLRYPLWHVQGLRLLSCRMTENCRAAIWYSSDISIRDSELHGIKALRECGGVEMSGCSIVSPEFGWSSRDVKAENCKAAGEYFFLRGERLNFLGLDFTGKYSFQYVKDATFENCRLDTKDAFWHGENITLKNCEVKGEYLAWYSKNLTLIDCLITGTQPLCYCSGLKLINCRMEGTDLAFERSEVEATVTTPILSVKNPISGCITAPAVGEIIRDEPFAKGRVEIVPAQ